MGRGSTKFEIRVKLGVIFYGTTGRYFIQKCFSLQHIPNTISEAADFKEGGCMQHSIHGHFCGKIQPKSLNGRVSSNKHTQLLQRRVVKPHFAAW